MGLALFCWISVVQSQPAPLRDLPLHRFKYSRQVQTGPAGFFMPTALEDDYFDGTSPASRVERHLALARRSGAKYFRCAFTWNAIEKEKGKYDWAFWDRLVTLAEQNGIGLIPYVAYSPRWAVRDEKDFWKQPPSDPALYADFMHTIAARYRGRIAAWEIWNEPDNRDYWTGTVEQFASLAKLAARRIREADPEAVLVLGGMSYGLSPFLAHLIAVDHIDRSVDVVALHAYPETWANERAETVFQQWIPAVRDAIANDRSGADLWVNEMGYADYRFRPNQASIYGTEIFYPSEHTRRYQAEMLFKFEVMALASECVSLTGWYRVDDFPASETRLGSDLVNYHLGLLDVRQRPKPALLAFQFFDRLFARPTRLVGTRVARPPQSQSVVDVFQSDGRVIIVAWLRSSLSSEVADKSGMLEDRRSEAVSVELPCARSKLEGWFDAEGRPVRRPGRIVNHWLEEIPLGDGHVVIAELACST